MADEFEQDTSVPAYLLAAESHSALNGATEPQSIFDAAYDLATKAIPLSIASGVTQALNTVPTIGNWLGLEAEQISFDAAVQEYDDDLSKYYTEHKSGIDVAGFMLGSMVPGMAGVKVLNNGQRVLN